MEKMSNKDDADTSNNIDRIDREVERNNKVNDKAAEELSFNIANKIQTEMTYPGQIKVTVIRETRAVNIAK